MSDRRIIRLIVALIPNPIFLLSSLLVKKKRKEFYILLIPAIGFHRLVKELTLN
ncbi:hypothetical protein [Saccharolobus sp. A20]|uniref:hypothetical protein n=1 Tax=Saccharolobus sp. A20 TaxID=1891280 RepID=UPI0012EA52E7|nr:hypothetical protein [Sulfolobus sp. A20]